MGFFHDYPYTDFHEINLDWILKQIMALHKDYDEFKAANTITNAGAWDITKQYQAWTIVSDDNKGYISLQPVPAGIAISNTDYWGLIADYDVALTDLTSRVSDLETATGDLDSRLDDAEEKLEVLTNRRFIFVADSLANYSNADGDNFITIAANNLGISSDDFEDLHQGGYGFKDNEFLSLLQNATISSPETVTDIIVFCGWNDISYQSSLETYVTNFVNYAKVNYPNAKISIGLDVWSPFENTTSGIFRSLTANFMTVCRNLGIYFIPNCNSAMHASDFYAADGVHPSSDGVDQLGKILTAAIVNGDGFVPMTDTAFALKTSVGSMTQMYYAITRSGLKIWSDWASDNQMHIDLSSTADIGNNGYTDIGEMDLTGWNVLDPHINAITVNAIVTNSGTDYRDLISFYIKGHHLFVMDHIAARHSVTDIYILPFTAVLDYAVN